MTTTVQPSETAGTYYSLELEQIQASPTSPFGMQFFRVPVVSVTVPTVKDTSTRSCDETSNDGSSKLDCVDDDD